MLGDEGYVDHQTFRTIVTPYSTMVAEMAAPATAKHRTAS
jgi:hypothetical protein